MAKTVGDLLSEEFYGIAVRRGDVKLLEKINAAIEEINKSGKYDLIKQKWL
jgi:ABC-type amino acid transport substrate-binding protein